jgi:hypothetical protein
MNRETFDTYVETQFAPTLREGDVVTHLTGCPFDGWAFAIQEDVLTE